MAQSQVDRDVPEGHIELLAAAKERVRQARVSATRRVNSELVRMYLALGQLILDRYRRESHGDGPTVGILLTGTRDDVVVEYALGAAAGPLAAVTYQALPDALKAQLPSPETLTHAIHTDERTVTRDSVTPTGS